MKLLAIGLIVLGLAALVYQGFSYTTEDTILEAGPIELTTDKTETIPLPPIVGVLAVAAGTGLLVFGTKPA